MTQARAPQWLLVALVTVFVGVSPVAGQQEIFAQGNQFYQAEDYAAAIEAYEAVRAKFARLFAGKNRPGNSTLRQARPQRRGTTGLT